MRAYCPLLPAGVLAIQLLSLTSFAFADQKSYSYRDGAKVVTRIVDYDPTAKGFVYTIGSDKYLITRGIESDTTMNPRPTFGLAGDSERRRPTYDQSIIMTVKIAQGKAQAKEQVKGQANSEGVIVATQSINQVIYADDQKNFHLGEKLPYRGSMISLNTDAEDIELGLLNDWDSGIEIHPPKVALFAKGLRYKENNFYGKKLGEARRDLEGFSEEKNPEVLRRAIREYGEKREAILSDYRKDLDHLLGGSKQGKEDLEAARKAISTIEKYRSSAFQTPGGKTAKLVTKYREAQKAISDKKKKKVGESAPGAQQPQPDPPAAAAAAK